MLRMVLPDTEVMDMQLQRHDEDEDIEPEDEAEHVSIADLRYDMAVVNRSMDVRKRAREL
jgi:hypothetical protein